MLLTVARDGSDLQTLIEKEQGGSLPFQCATPAQVSVDLTVVSGRDVVVTEPAGEPGLGWGLRGAAAEPG